MAYVSREATKTDHQIFIEKIFAGGCSVSFYIYIGHATRMGL